MKVYTITAEDKTLEKTYLYKFDAEQSLKKAGYENEGDDWFNETWSDSGDYNGDSVTIIYARIVEVSQ